MVYYLQQNVAILSQISQQLSFIAPQLAIPTTPPPPFPAFNPSPSNVRVNAFWFMALAFSLSAALLAILVQQWVRDHMHVFQRHSDPLKSARIRQYLHEGSDGWYMPVVAESVPGLLHISLFVFFVGLGDFVMNINTTVGLSTTIPIGIIGLMYIFTIFAPVIYPQSPYQNSFSGLVWYIIQKSKLFGRRFRDRDGESKFVSTNMTQGQMQLAMEETEGRKARDARAIWWLVDNLTEDAEMESLSMAVPGSFNGEWGLEVWKNVSEITEDTNESIDLNELATRRLTDTSLQAAFPVVAQPSSQLRTTPDRFISIFSLFRICTPSPSPASPMTSILVQHTPTSRSVMREHCRRMAHMFDTCKNRAHFASDELWRRRARACVEATTLLVCYGGAEFSLFGDVLRTLGDIGAFEKSRESVVGRDQSFLLRWTFLSIIAIRRMLSSNELIKEDARSAIGSFAAFQTGFGPEDEVAEKNAQEVEETLINAWWVELRDLCQGREGVNFKKILEHIDNQGRQMSELDIVEVNTPLESVDSKISALRDRFHTDSHGITRQFSSGQFDILGSEHRERECFNSLSNSLRFRFIYPCKILKRFQPSLNNMYDVRLDTEEILSWPQNLRHLLQRQLWRLQDLRDGGGLGFTVELFLVALNQLLSASPSQDSHSALYIATFRVITSDWSEYKHSLGTQKLLDAVASNQGIVHRFNYPAYITDELLSLLDRFLEGQTGPHIEDAVQQLSLPDNRPGMQKFRAKALRVISQFQAPSSL